MRRFDIDRTLKESLTYKERTFPIEICIDDYSLLPEHTLNCHWHHEYEFGLVLSGELDYFLNGASVRMQEGDCVFVNANTMHMATQAKDGADAVMFVAAFPSSLLAGDMNNVLFQKYFQPLQGKPLPGFVVHANAAAGSEIGAQLRALHQLDDEEFGYELLCLSTISRLWNATISYIQQNNPEVLERKADRQNEEHAKAILHYIREHFSEDISIPDITRHVNISQSECFRSFKRFTNKTPVEYINEYRLANAAKMLMETRTSITEISSACGFSHSSYFCKLFKQKYGASPARYRKGVR